MSLSYTVLKIYDTIYKIAFYYEGLRENEYVIILTHQPNFEVF